MSSKWRPSICVPAAWCSHAGMRRDLLCPLTGAPLLARKCPLFGGAAAKASYFSRGGYDNSSGREQGKPQWLRARHSPAAKSTESRGNGFDFISSCVLICAGAAIEAAICCWQGVSRIEGQTATLNRMCASDEMREARSGALLDLISRWCDKLTGARASPALYVAGVAGNGNGRGFFNATPIRQPRV